MMNVEIAVRIDDQSERRYPLVGEGGDIDFTGSRFDLAGIERFEEGLPAANASDRQGIRLHEETARGKAAHIALDGRDVAFPFSPGCNGVAAASPQSIFLVHVHHCAERAPGLDAQFVQKAQGFDGLHASGAVVVRSRPFVPAIDVASHHDDLFRELASGKFPHRVAGEDLGQCGTVEVQVDARRRTSGDEAAEPIGIDNADCHRGNFANAVGIPIAPVCGTLSCASVMDRTMAATPPARAASIAPRLRCSTAPP